MKTSGFTLVELSIVLLIVGLIVGGIVMGQALIHTAEINQQVRQLQEYEVAVFTFRNKYAALPGDMRDATAIWGANASCPVHVVGGDGTCDGNGDGRVFSMALLESLYFWDHLVHANLIPYDMNDISADGQPNLKLFLSYATAMTYITGLVNGLAVSWQITALNDSIEDMYRVDLKIDDGTPNGGRMVTTDEGDPENYCHDATSYFQIPSLDPEWICEPYYRLSK
ncbi:MAG: type II secretion system protein [Alphaproteobacteria bacterium]